MTNSSFAAFVGSLLLLIAVASWQFWTLTAGDNYPRTDVAGSIDRD